MGASLSSGPQKRAPSGGVQYPCPWRHFSPGLCLQPATSPKATTSAPSTIPVFIAPIAAIRSPPARERTTTGRRLYFLLSNSGRHQRERTHRKGQANRDLPI